MKTVLTSTLTAATLVLALAAAASAGIPNTFPQNLSLPSDQTTTQSDAGKTNTKSGN